MSGDSIKISCLLEGDSATDFEQLLMVLKVGQYAPTRQKQQSAMVGAAMLVLDATKQKYTEATGKRYPTLVDLLKFAGIAQQDIKNLLGLSELPSDESIASLTASITGPNKNKS